MNIAQAFGLAIKVRRTELRISQNELADRAEVARSFLSKVENGTGNATIATMWKLSQALKIPASDLWKRTETIFNSHQ